MFQASASTRVILDYNYLSVARMTKNLLETQYGLRAKITPVRPLTKQKSRRYHVEIEGNISQFLNEVGVLDDSLNKRNNIPQRIWRNQCCKGAFMKGVFLIGGYSNIPGHAYHLELIPEKENIPAIRDMMTTFGIEAKERVRRKVRVVYLKNSDDILRFYAAIGAHFTLLKLEDLKLQKEMKADINRRVNCEEANLSRTVDAAFKQKEAIRLIDERIGLDALSPKLRNVAELRLQYPSASISELADIDDCNRSTLYHRLKKLCALAESFE